jgi:hypothetical protein
MSTLPPLSHHDVLQRVAPFSRRGHAPDLAASDRAARRIVFRPVDHAAPPEGEPTQPAPLVERLVAEWPQDDRVRMVRTLEAPDGMQAMLEVDADDVDAALDHLASIPPSRLFSRVGGRWIAWQFHLRLRRGGAARGEPAPVLKRAEARLPGLRVEAKLSSVAGYPLEFELVRDAPAGNAAPVALPDDVTAVLGSAWERLVPTARGWRGAAGVRGAEPARSTGAAARMEALVRHLDETLAGPPAAFHQRHRAARWRVALRGTPPLLVGVALVVAAYTIQRWFPERASWIALLANMAPPVLMALFFMRREMPRIGLPRIPRCPPATAWSTAPSSAPSGQG